MSILFVTIALILALAHTGARELGSFARSLFLLSRACMSERRVIGILGRGLARKRVLRRVFAAAFWSIPSYVRGDYRQAGRRLGPLARHIETQLANLSAKQKGDLLEAADTVELMAAVFSHQMRCYLMGGAIEEAMQTLSRARACLGVERLAAFPEIDFKAAQLVKAGLAAGRLIDGSGLSALLINPPEGRDRVGSLRPLSPGVSGLPGLPGLNDTKPTLSKRRSRPRRISDFGPLNRGTGKSDQSLGVVIPMRRPVSETTDNQLT